MTITKRQYSHLSEMGINTWQQRHTPHSTAIENNTLTAQNDRLAITSDEILHHRFFLDLLQSIDCSVGEIIIEDNVINMGLFNWQFSDKQNANYANSTLTTPSLDSLKLSPVLKRALWQLLQENILS